MNRNRKQGLQLPGAEDIPENFNVGRFIFTKKTITYDNKTIQLSNVTKISKYGFRETYEPVFRISGEWLKNAGITAAATLAVMYFFPNFLSGIIPIAFVLALGIVAYGIYERYNKKPKSYDYFGLIIETASGSSENLLTNSREFIANLFNEITRAMNDTSFSSMLVANFHDHQITYLDQSRSETVYGDKFADIQGSTINNRSTIGSGTETEDELELDELLEKLQNLKK